MALALLRVSATRSRPGLRLVNGVRKFILVEGDAIDDGPASRPPDEESAAVTFLEGTRLAVGLPEGWQSTYHQLG